MRYLWLVPVLCVAAVGAVIAAEAVAPRERDESAESVRREVAGSITPQTLPKPRSWAFVTTTQSGKWILTLTGPDGRQEELAAVEVVVPKGKVAEIAVRTSLVVRDEVRQPKEIER